jgi:hypothetical protein
MTDRTLDRFLAAGLLAELKGDDGWYTKLAAAADALGKRLSDQPESVVPYLYAALDTKASPEDAAISAARGLVQEQWRSFASVFTSTPVLLMRAVILDAIVAAAKTNDACAAIVALLIGSALPNLHLGREAPVWHQTFSQIADEVGRRAEAEWSVPSTIALPPLSLAGLEEVTPTFAFPEVNKESLEVGFAAAVGPQNASGQNTGGNAHWPNAGQPWSHQFPASAASAVKETLDGVLQSGEEGIDLTKFSSALAATVSAHVEKSLAQVTAATRGLELRSRLLWWKEALYSPTARTSYRRLGSVEVPGIMAFDYHRPLPAVAPGSVTVFLEETVSRLLGAEGQKPVGLADRLAAIRSSPAASALREAVVSMRFAPGRRPLLTALAAAQDPQTSIAQLTVYAPDQALAAPDFAVLLFQELQAMKAVAAACAADVKAAS